MDTPIDWNMDEDGNFIDPRAVAMFNDWCEQTPDGTRNDFFEFIVSSFS